MDTPMDENFFANGTAFVGAFDGDHDVTFNCAGQVKLATQNVNISGKIYPHFANPIPRDIPFSKITVAGMNIEEEFFYKVDASSFAFDESSFFLYCSPEESIRIFDDDSFAGWWNQAMDTPLEGNWKAGECFVGAMGGNDGVGITFPAGDVAIDPE